jgi:NADH-quinone oxidoreductase subunit L
MLHTAFLIPALPLAGFIVLVVAGKWLGDPAAGWLATVATGGSFVFAVLCFFGLLSRSADQRVFNQLIFNWVPVGGLKVDAALLIDPLSITMALFVTGVGALIHLYAIGYMRGDPRYPKFFVYLNLFIFSMTTLVLANNFLVMFLGWEGVGACSYLLVSFWFERESAASAGKKAFVVNRVGDFGFMTAIFLLFAHFGSLNYADIFGAVGAHGISQTTANAIGLMFILGACGKSAQLPLYVWLPDAMEGPTPVSALIHAATMVTAGVYLMARINPILAHGPAAATTIAWIGAITALFAATVACAQNDIKRVLAYSTISQLGYMFLAVGSGAYVAGLFHMITHAFFKALLFLGAGSVIHGMHDEQDMKRMGALRKWMPITSATFLVGWLAISGIPPFAGFWSKDDILAAAWEKSPALWVIGFVTAGLTAYYMTRQVALVFFGQGRWGDDAGHADAQAAHADAPAARTDAESGGEAPQSTPEPVAAGGHGGHGAANPHESPPTMWVPLVVLAVLAFVGGAINLPWDKFNLDRWLEPVVGHVSAAASMSTTGKELSALATTILCLAGIGLGFRVWGPSAEHSELEPVVLRRAWYIDPLYAQVIERPGLALAEVSAAGDKLVIDGAVTGTGVLVRGGGGVLRKLQTGYVRNYALGITAGTVAMLAYVAVRAH